MSVGPNRVLKPGLPTAPFRLRLPTLAPVDSSGTGTGPFLVHQRRYSAEAQKRGPSSAAEMALLTALFSVGAMAGTDCAGTFCTGGGATSWAAVELAQTQRP